MTEKQRWAAGSLVVVVIVAGYLGLRAIYEVANGDDPPDWERGLAFYGSIVTVVASWQLWKLVGPDVESWGKRHPGTLAVLSVAFGVVSLVIGVLALAASG